MSIVKTKHGICSVLFQVKYLELDPAELLVSAVSSPTSL